MNRCTARRFLPLSLLAMTCFTCSNVAQAQQNSNPAGGGMFSPAASSVSGGRAPRPTGVFPSSTSALAGDATQGLAGQAGTASSTPASEKFAGEANSRSAWLAGSSSLGATRIVGWRNGAVSFTHTGTSWIAGGSSFSIDRQPGGVWRVNPPSGVPSGAVSQLRDLSSLPSSAPVSGFSTGLTPKGAAMIKAARPSGFGPNQGTGSYFGGSGAGQGNFGKASGPFAPQDGSPGTTGNSSGATSTPRAPASGTLTNRSLGGTLGVGTGESPSTSSH